MSEVFKYGNINLVKHSDIRITYMLQSFNFFDEQKYAA